MKLPRALCASLSALFLALLTTRAMAEIDFNFFYNELSPYGNWVQTADYGYVWQPGGVGGGWQPYTAGQWVYTDDGWTWVSEESWGWATYHYGRWTNLRGWGWCWVPGYEWAPAWVSWRSGGGYVGWAPLPPEAVWRPNVGISFGVSFGIGPSFYRFCPDQYFGYGNVGRYCVPPQNNVTIIQNTTNITNITNVVNNNQNVIYNGGPNYQELSRYGNVRRARIDRVETVNPRNVRGPSSARNVLKGDRLQVTAPRVTRADNARPPRVAAKVGPRQSERGWSDLTPAQRQNLRNQMVAETRKPRPNAGVTNPRPQPSANRPNTTAVTPKPLPAGRPTQQRPNSVPRPRPLPGQASQQPGLDRRDVRPTQARPLPAPDRVTTTRPNATPTMRPEPQRPRPSIPNSNQVVRPRPLPATQVPSSARPRPNATMAPRRDVESSRRSMEGGMVRPPATERPRQVAPTRPAPGHASRPPSVNRPAPQGGKPAPAKGKPARKDKSDD